MFLKKYLGTGIFIFIMTLSHISFAQYGNYSREITQPRVRPAVLRQDTQNIIHSQAKAQEAISTMKTQQAIPLCPFYPVTQQKEKNNPFKMIQSKAVDIFIQIRNLVWILAAFGLVYWGTSSIFGGEPHWKEFGTLFLAVLIISVAATLIKYLSETDPLGNIDTLKPGEPEFYQYEGGVYYACPDGMLIPVNRLVKLERKDNSFSVSEMPEETVSYDPDKAPDL